MDKCKQASEYKRIQLDETTFAVDNGIITKILIDDRYFFIFVNNKIDHTKQINLLVFYHGSRDIAMNCILSSTSLIKTFGNDNDWLVAFGQCDGKIQEPYIHSGYGKIAYGEIYWGITDIQNKQKDIKYTRKLVEYIQNNYNINKKVMMGHSNGGVFSLLMPIHLPNLFDMIISHQGGMGFDPYFGLDFDLVKINDNKPKLLFYTGTLDMHKNVCKIAHDVFLAEKYDSSIIIIDGLNHNYKNECEIIIKKWIEENI
jgi:hypothetical protein